MKLLYAEDKKALSDAVSEILDFYKHTVDAVYKGEDALYYLENEKIHNKSVGFGVLDEPIRLRRIIRHCERTMRESYDAD